MSETINFVPLRQPDDVDDPLTNILRSGRGSCLPRRSRWKPRRFSPQ